MSKALCGGVEGLEHFKGWALKPLELGERELSFAATVSRSHGFCPSQLQSLARRCVPTVKKDKEARELVALVEQHKAEVQREKDSGTDSRPSQCVCQLPLCFANIYSSYASSWNSRNFCGAWLAWSVLVWDHWRPRQRHRHCAACKSSLFLRGVFGNHPILIRQR